MVLMRPLSGFCTVLFFLRIWRTLAGILTLLFLLECNLTNQEPCLNEAIAGFEPQVAASKVRTLDKARSVIAIALAILKQVALSASPNGVK